jgi:hypothetical protein
MSTLSRSSGHFRWVDYARRSMQRLGFVKWALTFTSTSKTQTLEALTQAFAAAITKVIPVPDERHELFDRYARQQVRERGDQEGCAQIQDLCLSDPALPSRSGAITGDLERKGYRHSVYVEVPTWATRLELLRPQNYSLTDRGRVFLSINGSDRFTDLLERNPLILSVSEQFVALYCLLAVDGDFIAALYRPLLVGHGTFTRADAGEAAMRALQDIQNGPLKTVGVGRNQELRLKVEKTLSAMKKQGHGLGPKESVATPRTEPLVDCGLITKPDPDRYEYALTNWGRVFLQELCAAKTADAFLDTRFVAAFSARESRKMEGAAPPIEIVARPYGQLRSGLGYVSLRELALLSIAELFNTERHGLWEITAVEQVLRHAASENVLRVRIAAGRTGGMSQVRIDQRVFDQK